MNNHVFYIGEESVSKEKFIKAYNDSYFIDEKRLVKGTGQNSRVAENEMERLLKEGIKTKLDVMNILAWKIGKIRHQDSEDKQKIIYAKGWENIESCCVKYYNRAKRCIEDWDLNEFASYIVNNISVLENESIDSPREVLNRLKEKSPDGIGTVYLITLLYFISKGKWPIYDRFAMMALDGIKNGKKPGEKVEYRELPDKNSKKFLTVMEDCKENYIKALNDIFGDDYIKTRDIDRALWVYGHAFKTK